MILILDRSKRYSEMIGDIFYYLGILSNPLSYDEFFAETSNRYAAILLINPEYRSDVADFVKSIQKYSLTTPVFAICDPEMRFKLDAEYSKIFNKVFYLNSFSTSVAENIVFYQINNLIDILGDYKLAGIDACIFRERVGYFADEISLTKTETMILRYLTRTFPEPAPASDILKFAFKSTKKPEISSVRTHISSINKKFIAQFHRIIIGFKAKEGYSIVPICPRIY